MPCRMVAPVVEELAEDMEGKAYVANKACFLFLLCPLKAVVFFKAYDRAGVYVVDKIVIKKSCTRTAKLLVKHLISVLLRGKQIGGKLGCESIAFTGVSLQLIIISDFFPD